MCVMVIQLSSRNCVYTPTQHAPIISSWSLEPVVASLLSLFISSNTAQAGAAKTPASSLPGPVSEEAAAVSMATLQ